MKKLSSLLLSCTLLVVVALSAANCFAVVPAPDGAKSGSKASIWAAKMQEQGQKAMDWVSNSKVGKVVGDGVKAKEDAINYANKKYEKVQQAVKDAKNSKTYKSALISKDIGAATTDLKTVSADILSAKGEYEEQVAMIKQTAEGKIQALQNNVPLMEDYYKQKEAQGDTSLDQELDSGLKQNKGQLDAIQRQMEADIAKAEVAYNDKKDRLENAVVIKTKKVANLTKELGELNNVKMDVPDPMKAINNTKDDLFLKVNEIASIKNTKNKQEQRYRNRRDVLYETYEKALQQKLQLEEMREDVERIVDLADTMSGTSDVSGISTEVLLKQAEYLKVYVDFVVADLKREATSAITVLPVESKSMDRGGKFNLDNYKYQKPKANPLDAVKGVANKAKESKDKLQAGAQKVKNTAEAKIAEGKALKEKAENMKNDVAQGVNDVSGVIDGAKGVVNNPSALGGMM